MFEVYTDGSSLGNPGPGGWGFLVLNNKKLLHSESGGVADSTNNRMELLAAIRGLEWMLKEGNNNAQSIIIYTDSNYVKQGITAWIHTWIRRDWRLSKGGGLVKNVDLWKRLVELTKEFSQLERCWVKAHVGSKWNEKVDSLARTAAGKVSK